MRYLLTRKPAKTMMALCFLGTFSIVSYAQTVPDAGRLLQDTLPERDYQPRESSVEINFQGAPLTESSGESREVLINDVSFNGNTVYDDATLFEQVRHLMEKSHDMAGLQAISNIISRFYRDNGYPFAQALLPKQDISQGTLTIRLMEGNYGEVTVTGDETSLIDGVAPYLSSLRPGDVIQGEKLERTALLLGDMPGIVVTPVMRPGEASGTGDLVADVEPTQRVRGYVGVDNHGSRSSGKGRAMVGVQASRLVKVGDELSVTALYSEEDLWLGRVAYSLPIGYKGWRGEAAYARTEYDLRAPFSGFTGTADTSHLRLTYPLIRQQASNLTVSVGGEYTELNDRFEGVSYQQRYGHSWPLALQFDHRDSLGLGGVTYGEARLQSGQVNNQANEQVDGGYTKANLSLSRLQRLGHGFSLLLNGDLQWSDSPLDSSEAMSLGGARGVRAYPQGETSGSRAWLTQLEVRYQATSELSPYVFYDHGARQGFADESSEVLAGGGVGARYAQGGWSIDAAVAIQTTGDAVSQSEQKDPRFWISTQYRF
ncbi:ShlB/FhaC/HecB family hemolysin secretion/activation protein [Halomonas urumqiensis]|uniref:ShlB/FhaC/HecB family hemolysin secretion/activation protein n=1 Tax=Halomonas urumqiensis TaxID=1684789 RepID=A0A2N7UJM2_9GAMM|nr:ShlB/FhaC/HecB family hemolysin secretion/activation protein [Halomonas urumqiensis]PMR80632.1 ShlB/FhaC/HecB family hemolysin secretion/activation protein [Halomonas urumqiensis]PTB02706.1 ShlB/FhaC/HecB family hemolysin secretion/activation protein [Halomonas urumqiensis]GHE21204.1 hemolysin secretion protein ShlB [Halomonas urumqiensis]